MNARGRRPETGAPVRRRRAAGLGVGLLTAGLLALGTGTAAAHNVLVDTDPDDGSTVQTAPDAITLTFNEPAIALGTQIQVTGPDGAELAVGEPQLVDTSVVQPLADARPAGEYHVVWRVTSADGHPIEGELAFEATDAVGTPEGAATPTAEEPDGGATATEDPDATAPDATDDATQEGGDQSADDADQSDQSDSDTDRSDDGGSLPGWVIPVGVVVLVALAGTLVARAVRTRK